MPCPPHRALMSSSPYEGAIRAGTDQFGCLSRHGVGNPPWLAVAPRQERRQRTGRRGDRPSPSPPSAPRRPSTRPGSSAGPRPPRPRPAAASGSSHPGCATAPSADRHAPARPPPCSTARGASSPASGRYPTCTPRPAAPHRGHVSLRAASRSASTSLHGNHSPVTDANPLRASMRAASRTARTTRPRDRREAASGIPWILRHAPGTATCASAGGLPRLPTPREMATGNPRYVLSRARQHREIGTPIGTPGA